MRKTLIVVLLTATWLAACGVEPPPTLTPEQEQGQAVYTVRCAQCHVLVPDTIVVGPSLAGIATRAESRVPGYDAREYIELSILSPKDYIVEGFSDTMPTNFAKDLTSEEFDAVVAFLLTLK